MACGDCPPDVGSIPTASTIVFRRKLLSPFGALSDEGAFWLVVASVALPWRFRIIGDHRTDWGLLTLLLLRNRPVGFSFSVSIGLLQSVR